MNQIYVDTININKEECFNDKTFYKIFLIDKPAEIVVDFTSYKIKAPAILFINPNQYLEWKNSSLKTTIQLKFHSDFYCLNYHRNDVLFNPSNMCPHVNIDLDSYNEIKNIISSKIKDEIKEDNFFSKTIIKAYIKLILALSSRDKIKQYNLLPITNNLYQDDLGKQFQSLLEEYFSQHKSIEFYADKLHHTVDSFSRKIKKQLGISPSQLIQQRVILEAKRLLYLTFFSIKKIAIMLNFEDENYFSRYFKKNVGISPSKFRENNS